MTLTLKDLKIDDLLTGRKRDGKFVTLGVNWTWSLDGHDKLMGFQNWTFPLAIYGCYDTASRKVMFIRVWKSNSDPNLVGRWYFDHLYTLSIFLQN